MARFIDNIQLTPEEIQQARDYQQRAAYNRVFLHKMAELGFAAHNAEEQQSLLEMDRELQAREAQSRQVNRYKKAQESLTKRVRPSDHREEAVKIAQYLAANDNDLYATTLGLRIMHEREQGLI